MKAYTLRIEDQLLDALKHIAIIERKTVRQILLEIVQETIDKYKNENYFSLLKYKNARNNYPHA